MSAAYGTLDYWNGRYSNDGESFDWYQRWAEIKPIVVEFVRPGNTILNLGCGSSRLGEEMLEDGFTGTMNIDFSPVVIDAMRRKYTGKDIVYNVGNALELEFTGETFDLIIDKATLDTVLCSENCTLNVGKMLKEVHRVLKPSGVYICFSHAAPDKRLHYMVKSEFVWSVVNSSLPKPSYMSLAVENANSDEITYVYICKKGDDNRAN